VGSSISAHVARMEAAAGADAEGVPAAADADAPPPAAPRTTEAPAQQPPPAEPAGKKKTLAALFKR
jgi:hypothetical protein